RPRGLDIDADHPRRVEPEELRFDGAGERRVPVLVDERLWDLEAPERLDLPLRRAVPDRVRAPEDVVGPERADDLTDQVRARRRIVGHELSERGPELHVDVPDARLLLLHLTEVGGPRNLTSRLRGAHAQESRVIR